MEEFFFYKKLIALITLTAAVCCLPVFFLWCRPRVLPLKKSKSKLRVKWIGAVFGALFLLLAAEAVSAAPCDIKPAAPAIIRHNLGASYCELCSYGYITVVISNPYEGADMTNMTIVENLRTSGLTFDYTAPAPQVTYRVDGGPLQVGGAPSVSGLDGSILTWTSLQITELGSLAFDPHPFDVSTITLTFAVTRDGGLTQEGLISAARVIEAELTYTAQDTTISPAVQCSLMPLTVITGSNTLQLREPDPAVTKRGRNVDAAQARYSSTVYGNDKDDVIWRIRVSNNGDADLEDLRLDDVMESGNINIRYICPTEAAAEQIAITTNGIGPSTMGCVGVAGNSILNYDVDDPFGNPNNDLVRPPNPVDVDIPQGGNTDIFIVGKIPVAAPGIGACSVPRTNTVRDVEWGCEVDGPAGGIDATSIGIPLSNVTATLSTQSDTDLDIQVRYIGYGGNPVPGAKGRVRITIANNTGGTVKDLWLRNDLPAEYVVDASFTPTITATGAYGYYPGLTDRITWDNPDPDPLNNNIPEFTLTSSEANPNHQEQDNMLRNGDRLVITFGIILIRPESYDKAADLDVRTESPGDGTDPDHAVDLNDLTNTLDVDFENFCTAGTTRETVVTAHNPRPEDLDIDISGSVLDFILTNDPAQRLPLTVVLTNRGGHDAADYTAYVTFGRTMDVVTVPGGCATPPSIPTLDEWQLPAPISAGTTVYECTGAPIARNGGTRTLDFEVIKSTLLADIDADDLTFRADVIGEITDNGGNLLTYPPINVPPRLDTGSDRANNYSLDGIRARVIGFNLLKSQVGTCSENNPPPTSPDRQVQIGEECTYHIDTGGWFGFLTPGFTLIAVQRIRVNDELPDGQGYISSTNPDLTSTGAIQGIRLNPPGLAPLNEVTGPEWMNWTFNQIVPGQRITQKDHWFRVDMTSRLLNDLIDVSAPPNLHAALSTNTLTSTFEAVFDDGSVNIVHNLGPSIVGYPSVAVRQISMTVTEPKITVVKEVCNESLYGSGPSCSNFVPLADDGDAYNAYIYRLTLTNEASSGGVERAPAYEVTVTDRLDASDLAYVQPFDGDGLDNDGDGSTSGLEGTISDNTVRNGLPAVLTFSHTHSGALRRIDPGQSVRLYYRVDYDDDAAPLQLFTNTANATYDSLEGVSGNQSEPQRPNSDIGGARVYTSETDSAAVQILPVEDPAKADQKSVQYASGRSARYPGCRHRRRD